MARKKAAEPETDQEAANRAVLEGTIERPENKEVESDSDITAVLRGEVERPENTETESNPDVTSVLLGEAHADEIEQPDIVQEHGIEELQDQPRDDNG